MQTFLPFSDFTASAKALDRQRLGKQRVECLQLLKAMLPPPIKKRKKRTGWINHPALLMWVGYEASLVNYALEVIAEWKSRGYKDTCKAKILRMVPRLRKIGK